MSRKSVPTTEELFWSRVETQEGCWGWTGATQRGGYGCLGVVKDGKQTTIGAHRFSYELHFGSIPDGLFVLHSCDNPACTNPEHLRVGTNAENMADMRSKGRERSFVGEQNPSAKLTPAKVQEIRERYARGQSGEEIAAAYGVDYSLIRMVVTGKIWAHVPGADPSAPRHDRKGEEHHNSKLTKEDVRAIRAKSAAGMSAGQIARLYGVNRTAIGRILNGITWAHVE